MGTFKPELIMKVSVTYFVVKDTDREEWYINRSFINRHAIIDDLPSFIS